MFDDEPEAVVDQMQSTRLHLSEDREMALQAIMMLRRSYFTLEQFDAARQMLRRANERLAGRASLVFHQRIITLALIEQRGIDSAGNDELFNSALAEMLRARDMFREWNGPSPKPVALAMQAALAMGDPDRAVTLGTSMPDGEATEEEPSFGDVQLMLAQACLMLGETDRTNTNRQHESSNPPTRNTGTPTPRAWTPSPQQRWTPPLGTNHLGATVATRSQRRSFAIGHMMTPNNTTALAKPPPSMRSATVTFVALPVWSLPRPISLYR
jgi:hypothetical protein